MFFAITTDPHLQPEYPLVFQKINNFFVWLDLGWQIKDNIIYKGYVLNKSLDEKINNQDFSEETGNYIIIDLDSTYTIYTDNSRAFPLYYNSQTVSNMQVSGTDSVWFNGGVRYIDNEWRYAPQTNKKIQFDHNAPYHTINDIVDFTCNYMVNCCRGLRSDLPMLVVED